MIEERVREAERGNREERVREAVGGRMRRMVRGRVREANGSEREGG